MDKIFFKHYVFLEEINNQIKKNLLKFVNINIIINIDQTSEKDLNNLNLIVKFAKKNKIPFLFKNSFQKCTKYNSNGIFIDSFNKKNIRPIKLKKKFEIIGLAHNQLEYSIKLKQKCTLIMLSPLFFNKKYSKNKILNILKFNLIKQNWKIKTCPLGGINSKNLNLIKLTNSDVFAFKNFIYDEEIKKPAYNLM
jgi:thiamine-phosphate pyrophosphorylase